VYPTLARDLFRRVIRIWLCVIPSAHEPLRLRVTLQHMRDREIDRRSPPKVAIRHDVHHVGNLDRWTLAHQTDFVAALDPQGHGAAVGTDTWYCQPDAHAIDSTPIHRS